MANPSTPLEGIHFLTSHQSFGKVEVHITIAIASDMKYGKKKTQYSVV